MAKAVSAGIVAVLALGALLWAALSPTHVPPPAPLPVEVPIAPATMQYRGLAIQVASGLPPAGDLRPPAGPDRRARGKHRPAQRRRLHGACVEPVDLHRCPEGPWQRRLQGAHPQSPGRRPAHHRDADRPAAQPPRQRMARADRTARLGRVVGAVHRLHPVLRRHLPRRRRRGPVYRLRADQHGEVQGPLADADSEGPPALLRRQAGLLGELGPL